MKVSLTIVKYLIFLSCIICITNQYTISINKINNFEKQHVTLIESHSIYEFNCTPYFENDNRNISILITWKYNVYANVYLFYNKSKINTDSSIKSVGKGYDYSQSLIGIDALYLNPKQNIGYLVFADFKRGLDTFDFIYINMNGYYNMSQLSSYSLSIPYPNFFFTFIYKKNNNNLKKALYYYYTPDNTVKTTLYDKNKIELNSTNKTYGAFSFLEYNNIDEFYIKLEVIKGDKCFIDLLMTDYPNLFYLSQKNNTINFSLTKYSNYIFCVNTKDVTENEINFLTKRDSLNQKYIHYFYTNVINQEELKKELLHRFNDHKQIINGTRDVLNDEFSVPFYTKSEKLIFRMYTQKNKIDYYIRAIFFSSKGIYTHMDNYLRLNKENPYRIFNYRQEEFFNNSLNGFIFAYLNNSDKDCSLYAFNDVNDINLNEIKKKPGNLNEKNWKSFNYNSGDIYFLITNFKLNENKEYYFHIINNNEYYKITYELERYSNYTFNMHFNNTQNQFLTFSITPNYEYYLYFNIFPNDLKTNIAVLTNDNKIITPIDNIDNYYYFINYTNNRILFKILLTSDKVFSEFNINIKITEKLVKKKIFIISIIILGVIQIIMLIVYIIYLKRKNKPLDQNLVSQDLSVANFIN